MKMISFLVVLVIVILGLASLSHALSSETESNKLKDLPSKLKNNQNTDHNFEDFLVQGKYQISDQSIVTVEEDKALDGLIGVRNNFKDRIEQSTEELQ